MRDASRRPWHALARSIAPRRRGLGRGRTGASLPERAVGLSQRARGGGVPASRGGTRVRDRVCIHSAYAGVPTGGGYLRVPPSSRLGTYPGPNIRFLGMYFFPPGRPGGPLDAPPATMRVRRPASKIGNSTRLYNRRARAPNGRVSPLRPLFSLYFLAKSRSLVMLI
jgi:hypothetical protein